MINFYCGWSEDALSMVSLFAIFFGASRSVRLKYKWRPRYRPVIHCHHRVRPTWSYWKPKAKIKTGSAILMVHVRGERYRVSITFPTETVTVWSFPAPPQGSNMIFFRDCVIAWLRSGWLSFPRFTCANKISDNLWWSSLSTRGWTSFNPFRAPQLSVSSL